MWDVYCLRDVNQNQEDTAILITDSIKLVFFDNMRKGKRY